MTLRRAMLCLVFVCLVADNPQERPFSGQWQSPLYPIGSLLFDNLNKATGIDALRFAGLDVILLVALIAAAARRSAGAPVASGMQSFLTLALLTLAWLEVWGLVRGGNFKNSLWQLRQLVWLPMIVYIFGRSFRAERDLPALGKVVVASAAIKVGLGAYFLFVIGPGLKEKPSFATSHSDSLLFVAALFVVIANAVQTRSRRALFACAWVAPWIVFGLAINNRRLAFVSLGGGLLVMILMLRGALRRRLVRVAKIGTPLFLAYVVAGRNHGEVAVFKPAAAIASVFTQTDRSSATRDIENFNLIQTLKDNRLFGTGFGHEYVERIHADDISGTFKLYRYIGHNSVLWLWSVAGVVGFTAFWMFLAVGVFYGARAYRFAQRPRERSGAIVSMAVILSFLIQAYGDMGLQSWAGIFILALALVVAGKLAVTTGAWPQRIAS